MTTITEITLTADVYRVVARTGHACVEQWATIRAAIRVASDAPEDEIDAAVRRALPVDRITEAVAHSNPGYSRDEAFIRVTSPARPMAQRAPVEFPACRATGAPRARCYDLTRAGTIERRV